MLCVHHHHGTSFSRVSWLVVTCDDPREFGEGVDSARGVAAVVVCRRNSSCNSSCDAIARNGRRTIAFFLLFRVQSFVRNRLCEGMSQTCFECGIVGLGAPAEARGEKKFHFLGNLCCNDSLCLANLFWTGA